MVACSATRPDGYAKRGKFFASSFREAEFWGRPLLFGQCLSHEDDVEERWNIDAKMRRSALAKGYDSIVLVTTNAYVQFKASGKLPRSMELNVLNADERDRAARTLNGFQKRKSDRQSAGLTSPKFRLTYRMTLLPRLIHV
jgi:hypothetical protein